METKTIIILSLLLSGCASTMTYDEMSAHCFKVMEKQGVPRCSNKKEFVGWDRYQVGWELGNRSGTYHGCMGALFEFNDKVDLNDN